VLLRRAEIPGIARKRKAREQGDVAGARAAYQKAIDSGDPKYVQAAASAQASS
jgi:hypothetical protein